MQECPRCGRVFDPWQPKQRFCSQLCSNRWNADLRRGKPRLAERKPSTPPQSKPPRE